MYQPGHRQSGQPLDTVENLFDDATHNELDRAVDKAVEDDLDGASNLSSNLQYRILLIAIVRRSKDMEKRYLDMEEAKNLINDQGELRDMLASAWRGRSYREIRNLAILRPSRPGWQPQVLTTLTDVPKDLHQKLSGSFGAKYCGAAVEGFDEYLVQNEKLFKTVDNPKYYAKFCSIVQSSGTGKSRVLTELSKKSVIVVYMNLRSEQDQLGFPARDLIPSQILTEFPSTEGAYRIICYAFFTALFDTLQECFHTVQATRKTKEAVMSWAGQMCDMSDPPTFTARKDFFREVFRRYTKVYADHMRTFGRTSPASTTVESTTMDRDDVSNDINEASNKFGDLALSDPPDFAACLSTAYSRMAESLEKIMGDNSDRPKLVIAIDEAHPLTPMRIQGTYRPADVLCRVVNEYSHHENHAVWVVFVSTTSKVADFSPPNRKHNSDRVAVRGERLFPPFTQLGWDQSAFGLGDISIEDISKLDHVAGYGRPLWKSLKSALTLAQRVLNTASSKLCGGYTFDPSKTGHVLAVLGQRFGLNVTFGHPDSVEHLENGVASHLRICLSTTLDRNWRFTTYPSEPLLSCVAANDLHEKPAKLEVALKTLLNAVNSGMIDMGQRGELASRLLWLLSKDLFIRTEAKNVVTTVPSRWEDHLMDCQMIPVVDWLEFVFGPCIWEENATQTSLAREAFQDAYLNFSHWVCMDANIAGSRDGDELGLYEWTLRHWQRTSAVQCCHRQPLVDKVIPIYFKGGPESASSASRMSHIFVSDKARELKASKCALTNISRRNEALGGKKGMGSVTDSESLPYIAILADLGQPSSFSVTFPERNVDDCCMLVYAAGVDATTYPFLAKYPALMQTLKDLVRLQKIPEVETPYQQYLHAQMTFGRDATAESMEWEHGRNVPKVG